MEESAPLHRAKTNSGFSSRLRNVVPDYISAEKWAPHSTYLKPLAPGQQLYRDGPWQFPTDAKFEVASHCDLQRKSIKTKMERDRWPNYKQEAPLTLRGQLGRCRNIKGKPQIFESFPSATEVFWHSGALQIWLLLLLFSLGQVCSNTLLCILAKIWNFNLHFCVHMHVTENILLVWFTSA